MTSVQEPSAPIFDLHDQPLKDLDEWEDIKAKAVSRKRRRESPPKDEEEFNPVNKDKKKEEFRNYKDSARQKRVAHFYELQHKLQTYDFVVSMEKKYLPRLAGDGVQMGVWEALEYLDHVIDDSDPDTNLTQIQHALQTAEAIREKWPEEEYDWFALTGLIHDLGKIIAVTDEQRKLVGEPQWAVVGDTFPVGVPFSDKNIFPEAFKENPDDKNPKYNSGTGIYKPGCGLFDVKMSWGHDEYLYHVCVANNAKLPLAALYMIRYHSFYPWHSQGGYSELTNGQDRFFLDVVQEFNTFDLYSKSAEPPNVEKLKPYYQKVIAKYFPEKLFW